MTARELAQMLSDAGMAMSVSRYDGTWDVRLGPARGAAWDADLSVVGTDLDRVLAHVLRWLEGRRAA